MGILEAPSFQIPTVNIGDRQLGRVKACSVIDCGNEVGEIVEAINKAKGLKRDKELMDIKNPYEKEGTSSEIIREIQEYFLHSKSIKKKFFDISIDNPGGF